MSEPRRVPYGLRGAVSAACRLPPLRACGRAAYASVAGHCARRLEGFPGAEAVYLRGRDPREADPGISDLDFWLFCADAAAHDPATLQAVRARYARLRRHAILPGKLELTSERAWRHALAVAPAALAEDLPLRRREGRGWAPAPVAPARPARPASRVRLGSANLAQCLAHLGPALAGRGSRYHAAVAARYLGKAHAAATGEPVTRVARQPTPRALSETFLALDELASAALAVEPPRVGATLAIRPLAPGSRAEPTAALDRPLARLRRAGIPVSHGSPPGLVLWLPSTPDPEGAERLFTALLGSPGDLVATPGAPPITLATPSLYRCLWRGPRLGPLLERLPAIPAECVPAPDGEAALASDAYLHVLESLATRVNHAPGALVSYPPGLLAAPLLYECTELFVVATAHVTNDLDALRELARDRLPATSAWLERLRSGACPTDIAGWSGGFAQVRAEALATLDELAPCDYRRAA